MYLSEESNSSRLYDIFPFLSEEKKKRIERFYHKIDALRTLGGEWLMRNIIEEEKGLGPEEIVFEENEYGKLFLKDHNDFHFNISHSGRWIVSSIGTSPSGIDIEKIVPIDFAVAERFFSKEECDFLFSVPEEKRLDCFYEIWTLKESFIKAEGMGLSIPLDSFSINFSQDRIELYTTKGSSFALSTEYYFKQYEPDKNYKMAVCSRENNFSPFITVKHL